MDFEISKLSKFAIKSKQIHTIKFISDIEISEHVFYDNFYQKIVLGWPHDEIY